MSLAGLLDGAPDDAVHTIDETVRRASLQRGARALAESLAAADVGPGEVVAVMLSNGPDVVVGLFGVWRAGAVYAPLNPRATDAELSATLATLAPAAVVTTADLGGRFTPDRPGGALPLVSADGSGWRVDRRSRPPAPAAHDPDVALLQFTSGTTGPPKPVPMRHSTVLDLIDRFLGATRQGSGSAPRPNLVPVPLSLWAGIYQVLFAFRLGASVVLMEKFETAPFAQLVARFEIRTTVLPPAALTMLTEDLAIEDLAPLRKVRSITAPLSPVQARRFRDRFGVVVVNSYGQTELGGQVVGWTAADERAHAEDKLGSVGRALPGIEVATADGEVVVRTPATTTGRIDAAFHDRLDGDGWFHTGDLGTIDPDGFLWLSGRVSDMINRGGNKVFPAQVEEILLDAPGVREAAVVGVPDDRLGEVPWAFVVATGVDEATLIARCREKLTPYKVPVRVVEVEALPRNEVGKILKRELAELATAAR